MRKKFIPLLLSLIMLFFPLALSGCGDSGSGDIGGGDIGGNENLSSYSDYFNSVKVIEKMSFDDMSVGSPAYNFTSNVVQQIKTLSTEILLRLCGDFGDGLSVENALLYGIGIEEDIMPEDYELQYGVGCFEVIHFDNWKWKHVVSTERLPYPSTQIQYIDCYLEEYVPEQKEDYEDKLTLELFKLLTGITPQNLEQETLINCARNLDYTGFLERDMDKIEAYILENIIGSTIVSNDEYRREHQVTIHYRNYTGKVEAIVETSVSRTVEGVSAYPVIAAAQFNEKKVEDFGINSLSDNSLTAPAKQYRSVVFNTKKVIDITAFSILFEIPESETSSQVTIDITGKYQVYNSATSSYDIINANLGFVHVTPGNINTNSNKFTVDFKNPSISNQYYQIHNLNALRLGLFTNNSPLPSDTTYMLGTTGGLFNYDNYFKAFETYYNNNNIEYEDNTTPFFQLFFEITLGKVNANFKFAFTNITIEEVK